MPTLFYYLGLRFYFHSNDHEPIHIYVACEEREGKFCIFPEFELIENYGLSQWEIKYAMMAIDENKNVIVERWNEYFDK